MEKYSCLKESRTKGKREKGKKEIMVSSLSEEVTNLCLAELVRVVSLFVGDPGSSPRNCNFEIPNTFNAVTKHPPGAKSENVAKTDSTLTFPNHLKKHKCADGQSQRVLNIRGNVKDRDSKKDSADQLAP
ncbi:hypothetical protein LXL04_029631 [Taraxacum kok-saghyz]